MIMSAFILRTFCGIRNEMPNARLQDLYVEENIAQPREKNTNYTSSVSKAFGKTDCEIHT